LHCAAGNDVPDQRTTLVALSITVVVRITQPAGFLVQLMRELEVIKVSGVPFQDVPRRKRKLRAGEEAQHWEIGPLGLRIYSPDPFVLQDFIERCQEVAAHSLSADRSVDTDRIHGGRAARGSVLTFL
jgi:hypothetical protein